MMKKKICLFLTMVLCTGSVLTACAKGEAVPDTNNDVVANDVSEAPADVVSDTPAEPQASDDAPASQDAQEFEIPKMAGVVIKYDANDTVLNLDEVKAALWERAGVKGPAELPQLSCTIEGAAYRPDLVDPSIVSDDDPNLYFNVLNNKTSDLTKFSVLKTEYGNIAYGKVVLSVMYKYCDEIGIDRNSCEFMSMQNQSFFMDKSHEKTYLQMNQMDRVDGFYYVSCSALDANGQPYTFIIPVHDILDEE